MGLMCHGGTSWVDFFIWSTLCVICSSQTKRDFIRDIYLISTLLMNQFTAVQKHLVVAQSLQNEIWKEITLSTTKTGRTKHWSRKDWVDFLKEVHIIRCVQVSILDDVPWIASGHSEMDQGWRRQEGETTRSLKQSLIIPKSRNKRWLDA